MIGEYYGVAPEAEDRSIPELQLARFAIFEKPRAMAGTPP